MLASSLVTKAMTAGQLLLNLAMNANPVGLIITGIGLLIGAGILLYQNWDKVKAAALALWEGIKSAFTPVGAFFGSMWDGIKSGFSSLVNFIIDGINLWLSVMLTPLNLLIKAVNLLPMISIPEISLKIPNIPKFALGTQNFKGGLAQINERGGEIVDLPNGSKVIPADKSKQIMSKSGGHTFNFYFNGNVGNKEFFEEAGNYISSKILTTLATNM